MRELWQRMEKYLRKRAPAALACLNPPSTMSKIRRAEKALGLSFPSDLVESLLIHNGQRQETGRPPHAISLVPNEYGERGDYRATFGELAPLDLIVSSTLQDRQIIAESQEWVNDVEYEGPVRRDGNWSWVTFVDAGSGDRLGLDVNPVSPGTVGQVLSIIHSPFCLFVLAPSYREWFEELVERHESGRYAFIEEDGDLNIVDTAGPEVRTRGPRLFRPEG